MTVYERLAPSSKDYFGDIEFIHKSPTCRSSAFDVKENVIIKLSLPRNIGAKSVDFTVYDENCSKVVLSGLATWCDTEQSLDIYEIHIEKKALPVGLYFCRISVTTLWGALYGHIEASRLKYTKNTSLESMVQVSVYHYTHSAPNEIYGGIIYHIFVDRFNRGGKSFAKKDAIFPNGEWQQIPEYPEYPGAELKNNTFYGGTLDGIIDKLDYIASLGANVIYLSPIFESPSNHRYDTSNYMKVDGMLGGDEALIRLIDEAKKRGIKIILDGVFNHTGDDSIYFNRQGSYSALGAYQSTDSPYYSWYDFKQYPDKYTCWWDIDILPRINPDIPSCRNYFVGNEGVISKWRGLGIYGLRLDVADELSDSFISSIKEKLSNEGESILYGEVWEDASNKIAYGNRKQYYLGNELDGVMNYPLRKGIIDYITKGETASLNYALREVMINAPERVMHAQMNLLGTHDTERILTTLGGAPDRGKANSSLVSSKLSPVQKSLGIARLKAAYTVLATLPGIPAIFYGDEAGLEGYSDPFNRLPYPWGRECRELLSHYKKVGVVRRKHKAYVTGDFKLYYLTSSLLVFSRCYGSSNYVTVYNNSNKPIKLSFSSKANQLILDNSTTDTSIAPYTAEIYKTGKNSTIQIIG